ncbi:DUF6538 domain-containing protein [Neorhizobium galegae]|uniref:DUF6538 domain-containing protein n=1 Tax=Neorhizobium galegae TaxID=399 RepID=UPI00349E5D3D
MKKASIKYLFERNKTFYFRMSIPPAKRADFKKREFVESLGTRSLEEAITLLESKTQFYLAKLAGIETDDSVAALRVYSRKGISSEPSGHELDHCGLDEGEACG